MAKDPEFTAIPLGAINPSPRQQSSQQFQGSRSRLTSQDSSHRPALSLAESYSSQRPLHANIQLPPGAQSYPPGVPPIPRDYAQPKSRASSPPTEFNEKPSRFKDIPPLSRESSNWASKRPKGQSPYGQLPAASNSDPNLLFAEGDFGKSQASRGFLNLIASNIIVRWACFIIPITALLWLPGILGVTSFPDATVWDVKLLNWSIWLTILYAGYFGCLGLAMMGPSILKHSIGVIAPELKHHIEYLNRTKRFLALVGWALVNWITFNVIVNQQGNPDKSQGSGRITNQIVRGWFAIFIDCCILLGEKLVIQIIARNFHKTSYEDRISAQKYQIRVLTKLYVNSRDIGRSDTLDGAKGRSASPNASRILKAALSNVKKAAQASATPIGLVASEIAGERVLQPNSPSQMVTSALSSQNKSRQLARRIFFSFVSHHSDALHVADIARMFASNTEAQEALAIFDKDGNGDATMDEVEMALVEIHKERMSLASSMRDVDSAVAKLDSILMSVYYLVAILVLIGMLDVSLNTLIASAGTFILGLSWLIGATAQEILLSCIFLFAKHPYDVGDRVDVDADKYVVKEMNLLSTIFQRVDGAVVQMPHTLLNTKAIINIRRSGALLEMVTWNVDYGTTFEAIEKLREKMLDFLEAESRDFFAAFDCSVLDLGDQGKLELTCAIKYKSNWQNGQLKAQRRNKWMCALRLAMASVGMWGPGGAGNPNPPPAPTLIQMLHDEPAQDVKPKETETVFDPKDAVPTFAAQRDVIADDSNNVFDGPTGRPINRKPLEGDIETRITPEKTRAETVREQYLRNQP